MLPAAIWKKLVFYHGKPCDQRQKLMSPKSKPRVMLSPSAWDELRHLPGYDYADLVSLIEDSE